MNRKKKKQNSWFTKCYLCEEIRECKWKWKRDKKKRICEACHLARQRMNEKKLNKPKGAFSQTIEDLNLKEFF